MTTEDKGVPTGASAIIPRLVCRDVEAEIDFCCQTFGAVESVRRPGPDGKVAHAMLRLGPAMLMLEAEWPTLPSRAPNVRRVEETSEDQRRERWSSVLEQKD